MVRALRTDTRASREHALGRLAEGDGNDALPLSQPFASAQEERHAGPAPIVDEAFQRDEGLGLRFRVDTILSPIPAVLPTDHVGRLDREHAAEDLVLFLARTGSRAQTERLRNIDLHVVNEVAVPSSAA